MGECCTSAGEPLGYVLTEAWTCALLHQYIGWRNVRRVEQAAMDAGWVYHLLAQARPVTKWPLLLEALDKERDSVKGNDLREREAPVRG